MEVLGKLKKSNDLIGNRNRDLPLAAKCLNQLATACPKIEASSVSPYCVHYRLTRSPGTFWDSLHFTGSQLVRLSFNMALGSCRDPLALNSSPNPHETTSCPLFPARLNFRPGRYKRKVPQKLYQITGRHAPEGSNFQHNYFVASLEL
jgi:hypothetical protein